MKSSKTMLGLAKAIAVSKGPRIWCGTRCGVYVTMAELNELYLREGFNREGSAMRRHMKGWMEIDQAVLEGSVYVPESALWFEAPEDMETVIKVFSQNCGGRYVTRIDRTQWPVLRRMHGIQEQEVLA